ncbi:N-ALPHA-ACETYLTRANSFERASE 20 [Salix viminalis]|uniref:N-ALPHA-ACETYLTRANSFERASE 20 n=1 Tax=Salix viminalis TaxID=40686 RepID=A0A9Q0UJ32_SALVM|nr:N-ALPHA-ACETYLTRANSFERASE 20 [Salix viminalis]
MLDYMTYLARWPDYFHVAEGSVNKIMGYLMGKVEGQGESWHGHVTAVTVATEYRRQQLAKKLMNLLEDISDKIDKAYFVDLFVRASNTPAIKMSEKSFYIVAATKEFGKGSLLLLWFRPSHASDDFLLVNLYTNLAPLLVEIIWVFYFDKVYTLIRSILAYNMQIGFPLMRLYSTFRYDSGVKSSFSILDALFFLAVQSMSRNDSYSSAFVSQLGYEEKASSRDVEKKSITGEAHFLVTTESHGAECLNWLAIIAHRISTCSMTLWWASAHYILDQLKVGYLIDLNSQAW